MQPYQMLEFLFSHLRSIDKENGLSTKIYDNPLNYTKKDYEEIAYWSEAVKSSPDMEIPKNLVKAAEKKVQTSYNMSVRFNIAESNMICYSLVNDLLSKVFGSTAMCILEP